VVLLPKRIILQRLLDSPFNLLAGQANMGMGEFLASPPHERHGVKCLLLVPHATFLSGNSGHASD